jgi:hypothetical protein
VIVQSYEEGYGERCTFIKDALWPTECPSIQSIHLSITALIGHLVVGKYYLKRWMFISVDGVRAPVGDPEHGRK